MPAPRKYPLALPRETSRLVARGVVLVLPLLETTYVAVSVLDVLRIGHEGESWPSWALRRPCWSQSSTSGCDQHLPNKP